MNVDDLYAFIVVSKEKSFSKAAKRLNYTQSNITAKMKKLEQLYKTKLFFRVRSGVKLTSNGEILLKYAKKIIEQVEQSKNEIIYSAFPSGILRIGSMETTVAIRLPELLRKYNQTYPEVNIELITGSTDELIHSVLERNIDGAFIAGEVPYSNLSHIEVFRETLVFIAKEQQQFATLDEQTMIAFKSGCFYRKQFEKKLEQKGILPKRFMELNTLDGIIGCIKAGLGVTMLPKSALNLLDLHDELVPYSLTEEEIHIPTMFIYHADYDNSKSLSAFIQACAEWKT